MNDEANKLRERLLDSQSADAGLRESYERELQTLLNPELTLRTALPGIVLLVLLVGCAAGIIWASFFYRPAPLLLAGWSMLAVAFLAASYYIVRDLRRRTHSPKSAYSVAGILTMASGTLTVVALLLGLHNSSDPKSLFGAFYVFVFYFACATWSLDSRIAAAELSSKEQSLRIEHRLAEIAERLEEQQQ
jgi:hypothetical protein